MYSAEQPSKIGTNGEAFSLLKKTAAVTLAVAAVAMELNQQQSKTGEAATHEVDALAEKAVAGAPLADVEAEALKIFPHDPAFATHVATQLVNAAQSVLAEEGHSSSNITVARTE